MNAHLHSLDRRPYLHVRLSLGALLTVLFALYACATGDQRETRGSSSATGGSMGSGGSGGDSPCPVDCATIITPSCQESVCNTGQHPGPVGQCAIVPLVDDVACDDDLFCTDGDTCQAGVCTGGQPNLCGNVPNGCELVTCNEMTDDCTVTTANPGMACTPSDLCMTNGICTNGLCLGTLKDCFFAPVGPCELAVCNPMNGLCEGQTDPNQNGQLCVDPTDLCTVGKTCSAGACQGGGPKDCSALNVGCTNGVCDVMTGVCMPQTVMPGDPCAAGDDQCNVGICDNMQNCVPMPVMNGTPCDDNSLCTTSDVCTNGSCVGMLMPNCKTYMQNGFETCPPAGWTLNPEWECGVPTMVGPPAAFLGMNVIGTDLDADYDNGRSYAQCYAQTPPIGLGTATAPVVSFKHWVQTEGSIFDGYNLKVSNNGGASYSVLTTVTPPYNLTVGGQPAWGGDQSAQGWQEVTANLSAFIGQQIILRLSFQSDGSITDPGVYVDDFSVAEPDGVPLHIVNTSLPNGYVGFPYIAQLTKTGGTAAAIWSIQGGMNHGWLSINSATGLLSGTPAMGNLGAVTVTVRVQEPSNPPNFEDKTFMFNVGQALYFENFEGTCPVGWTLLSDWQCGVPTSGPNGAYSGTKLIATNLAGNYSNGLAWATTTATSPAISLVGTTTPEVRFRVWYETESGFDGFNLKVSNNGGVTYTLLTNVVPVYNETLGEQCWAGTGTSWQELVGNLSAYAGQTINLRFAFQSDTSVTYPGVYIDDVLVTD